MCQCLDAPNCDCNFSVLEHLEEIQEVKPKETIAFDDLFDMVFGKDE